MKNKRFIAVTVAIIFASATAGWVCYRCKLTGAEGITLYKNYSILIGALCGAYTSAQSLTDTKKIKEGGEDV